HLAPLVVDPLDLDPVVRADLHPALAERTRDHDRGALAGGGEVRDRRVHRPRAGRGEEERLPARPVHLLQPNERALVALAEVEPTVVHHGLGRRREHLGRDGSRAWCEEVALLHRFPGYPRSFARTRSLTMRGSALPPVVFITWPTKKPSRPSLPPRYCSACAGFAAITSSMTGSSSARSLTAFWAR